MVRQKRISIGGTVNLRSQCHDAAVERPRTAVFACDVVEIHRVPKRVGLIFVQI
jgi:hypothetical protein